MSSSDLTRRVLLLSLAGGLVAACQVHPVYAPVTASGTTPGATGGAMADRLASIAIEVQSERVSQTLMNELIFALRGGAALQPKPRYSLHLIVTTRVTDLAIEVREDVPAAKLVALTATYTLTEIETRRAVTNGSVYTSTSFDFSSQRFANVRAEIDAENRAARQAAQEIRLRLTTAFASEG